MHLGLTTMNNYFIMGMIGAAVWMATFIFAKTLKGESLPRSTFLMFSWMQVFTASGFAFSHGSNDIANAIGTPILAAADGVVISAGYQGGYGNMVKLRHADGTVTLYGHNSAVLVNVGERVMAGDQIAKMGNTGNSTGPHCHFEVHLNGTDRVDPVGWLAKHGLTPGSYVG